MAHKSMKQNDLGAGNGGGGYPNAAAGVKRNEGQDKTQRPV